MTHVVALTIRPSRVLGVVFDPLSTGASSMERREVAPASRFDAPDRGIWDSAHSDLSDGRSTMNKAPVVLAVSLSGLPPAANSDLSLVCADGRALERVGSWLAQPAGLPAATDILGQCFVDAWVRNRGQIAIFHARAERMHDALDQHATSETDAGVRQGGRTGTAWQQHQRVLHGLVECQQMLLGPQAAAHPVAQRKQALRRLASLLTVEKDGNRQQDDWSRAG